MSVLNGFDVYEIIEENVLYCYSMCDVLRAVVILVYGVI